ncbi:MAG: permease-like cell division protein FtsX [Oscillospiraceae bacterium]|jgi:cell division transport system permease protein|nr:permease-like cell division protein FtsX [Oscillospiraceae bacterium]
MKRSAAGFSYFLTEGIRGIFLHGFMSFAAVGVIVACLLIMGSFALISANINAMIQKVERSNEITVFIDESYTDAQARSVGSAFASPEFENIMDARFKHRDQAWEEYVQKFSEDQQWLFTGFDESSVLRHRYQITLVDITKIDETIGLIESVQGVVHIRADLKVAQGLATTRRIVEAVSVTLILVLLLVSVFIISNTIKLATFDRREEIGIMRIVGATKSFIRWPFVVEGVLLGLGASVTGFFLQGALYSWFTGRMLGGTAIIEDIPFLEILPFGDMMLPIAFAFIVVGFLVGVGGSLLTIRKFLQV